MGEVGEMKKYIEKEHKSYFFILKCKKCGSMQVSYSHASTRVKCRVCGNLLLEPTGGKAKLVGAEIVKILE